MYPPNHRTQGATADDIFLLLFRLAIVTVLIIFQLVPEATSAWAAIWHEEAWPLADKAAEFGIPQTKWIVASAVVFGFLAALGVACGFITRLSCMALLVGPALLGHTAVAETDVVSLELAIVYSCVLFYLLLRGPGHVSADRYFSKAES